VKNNQLFVGPRDQARRDIGVDYCLLKIDFVSERSFSSLPSSKLWTEIKGMVWEGQFEKARATFLEMGRQLATSPDITRPHRFNLIRIYKMNLESEIELFRSTKGDGSKTGRERSGAYKLSGRARIEQIRPFASGPLLQTIRDMTNSWEAIPLIGNRPINVNLDDRILLQQMSALPALPQGLLESKENYPKKLVDAITTATFDAKIREKRAA